jgi:hypothetical protein
MQRIEHMTNSSSHSDSKSYTHFTPDSTCTCVKHMTPAMTPSRTHSMTPSMTPSMTHSMTPSMTPAKTPGGLTMATCSPDRTLTNSFGCMLTTSLKDDCPEGSVKRPHDIIDSTGKKVETKFTCSAAESGRNPTCPIIDGKRGSLNMFLVAKKDQFDPPLAYDLVKYACSTAPIQVCEGSKLDENTGLCENGQRSTPKCSNGKQLAGFKCY